MAKSTKKKSSQDDNSLVEGALLPIIARLALPMIFGIIAVFSVALVDTYFVGKLGTDQLAALSFTFPVTMAIASLSSGLGAGASSVVSRAIGADNKGQAKRLATDSLLLAVVLVITISAIGYFTITPLFKLMGATEKTLPYIIQYMEIWYISMPFLVIPIVANAIIRSVGNALWPSFIMFFAAAVNIALTPALIFGIGPIPAMNIEGAAISTMIARIVTFILALYVAYYREEIIELCRPELEVFKDSCKSVLKIALPAGAGSVVNPVGIGIVTTIIAAYGSETVAAFGVATRIESFACIPMLALSASIGPIAGQNWGAGNKQRVIKSVQYCYLLCLAWSALIAGVFFAFADVFTSLLASNENVAEEATVYLLIVAASLVGYGFVIVSSATFNSLGKSISGFSYYAVRTFALYVPLSMLASIWFDETWVYIGIAVSNLVSGALVATYTLLWLKKAKQEDCHPNWSLDLLSSSSN
ncbi:MAG: putative MATE family efflux protein [Glaciecola sp.]